MSGPHSYSGQSHDGSRRFELRIVGALIQVDVLEFYDDTNGWRRRERHSMAGTAGTKEFGDAPDWMRWMIRTMAENLRPMP